MSASVEERVVQMRFNNDQFESKAKNTISTLNTLDEALKLNSATKGLDTVQNGVNKINFEALNGAIETINYRFSTLGIIATNVLNKVANAAISTGKRLVDSVTIAPIRDGFKEYELMMDSVKRILNSAKDDQGLPVTLDAVNQKLDELNTYADKTIYSFSDMTTNIGKFTNAGVSLDKSVAAIQGIANEAALAGANSEQASHAMYNFAQALSAGYVKMIDWRSIEQAQMATVEFKNELIKTAAELGTITKQGDKYVTTTTDMNGKVSEAFDATSAFNESLSHQWMTSEVLTETLAKYANEEEEIGRKAFQAATEVTTFTKLIQTLKEALGSGWTHTWQAFIGDFEESKKLWTAINNVLSGFIDSTSNSRNEMLKLWKSVGGRDALIKGMANLWRGLESVLKPVAQAYHDVLDPLENWAKAANFSRLSKGFANLTSGLKLNWKEATKVKIAAKGLFSVVDLGKQVINAFARTLQPLTQFIKPIASYFLDWAVGIGGLVTKFAEATKANDTFYNVIQKGLSLFQPFIDFLKRIKESFEELTGIDLHFPTFSDLLKLIDKIKASIGDSRMAAITSVLTSIGDAVKGLVQNVKNIGILDSLATMFESVGSGIGGLIQNVKNSGALSAIGEFLNQLATGIGNIGSAGLKAITGFFTDLSDSLGGFNWENIIGLAGGAFLVPILNNVRKSSGILPKMIEEVKKIFTDTDASIFGKFSESIKNVLSTLSDTFDEFQNKIKIEQLKTVAMAIAILTGSLWVLSSIDSGKLAVGIIAIGAMMKELSMVFDTITKIALNTDIKKLSVSAGSLVAISAALLILSAAVKNLSKIDDGSLAKGVIAIGVLMALMTAVSRLGGKKFSAKGLIGMSVAILIIQKAISNLAKLDEGALARGTIVVAILMALMTAMSRLGGKKFSGKGMLSMAVSIYIIQKVIKGLGELDDKALIKGTAVVSALMILMGLMSRFGGKKFSGLPFVTLAVALVIMQKAIKELGELDDKSLAKGVGAVAVLMTLMTLMSRFTESKGMLGASVGMFIISEAMTVLSGVITELGSMDIKSLAKGLIALGAALVIVGLAANLMSGTLGGAAAMLIMAIAINALVPPLTALASVPFAGLVAAIGALAAAFAVLWVAGVALSPLVGTLLALGAAITLMGVGVLALGAGLVLLAAGFAAFSASALAAASTAEAILNVISKLRTSIVKLAVGTIVDIASALLGNISTIQNTITQLVLAVLKTINELAPALIETVVNILLLLINTLSEKAPMLIEALVNLAINLIDGFALAIYNNTDRIIAAVRHVLGAVIDFILATIQEVLRGLPVVGGQIEESIGGIRESIAKEMAPEKGEEIGSGFGSGVATGANSKVEELESSGFNLADAAKGALKSSLVDGGEASGIGSLFGEQISSGIDASSYMPEESSSELMQNVLANAEGNTDDAYDIGKFIAMGTESGLLDNSYLAENAGGLMSGNIMDQIAAEAGVNSPSTKGYEIGKYIDEGLALGMTENQSVIATAASTIGEALDGLFNTLKTAFSDTGVTASEGFSSGIASGTSSAVSASSVIAESAIDTIKSSTPEFRQNGINSGKIYARAISSTAGASRSAGSVISKSGVSGTATSKSAFTASGRASGISYSSGIKSKSAEARSAGTSIGNSAANGARGVTGFYEAGRDSSQGYINGLMSKAGDIARAAAQVVRDALAAARDAIDSHSPSRAWEAMGVDSDEGYILGVKAKARKVNEATAEVAEGAMKTFQIGISRAAQAVSDEAFVTPTITPVMDTSSLYTSIDYLNGLFNDGGSGILGTVQADIDNDSADIKQLVTNTNQILNAVKEGKIITLNGDVLFNYINRRFGQA